MIKVILRSYPQVINRLKIWGRRADLSAQSTSIQKEAVRSDPVRWAARLARSVIGSVLSAFLCLLPAASYADTNKVNKYKAYAGQLLTPLEFSSALVLWTKESNWNPKAKNGSHYGICQGRSKYLKDKSYKVQIRWCIGYARSRYGSITEALEFWKVHRWH